MLVHPAGEQCGVRGSHGRRARGHQRPADRKRPLVRLDEFAKLLISKTQTPLPARPGSLGKHDSEYVRWQFKNEDARIKLHPIHPSLEDFWSTNGTR